MKNKDKIMKGDSINPGLSLRQLLMTLIKEIICWESLKLLRLNKIT